jgi:soluble lytic murein transglycosylase-like protein
MQISEIVLKEYNQAMFLCDVYKPDDLYDPALNMSVGTWYITEQIPRYLKNYNIPDTADNRLIAYNWGIGNLKKWWFSGADYKKLPKETRNYLLKYTRLGKR